MKRPAEAAGPVAGLDSPSRTGHGVSAARVNDLGASPSTGEPGGGGEEEGWSWDDGDWMGARAGRHGGDMPLSLYRLCAADWYVSRFPLPMNWNRLAQELVPYVADLGFTHIVVDDGLVAAPYAVVCQFVETCHVAGVGVVVQWPASSLSMPESEFLAWCQRCHLDGVDEGGREAGGGCRLFRGETVGATLTLHRRPQWQVASADYLALSPAGRSRRHRDWIEALTPSECSRGLLEQVPDERSALGEWRQGVHGDEWQRFAAFRACLALMWALPGDKQVAMGVELGQVLAGPWESPLHWPLLFESRHAGMLRLVADLNRLYVNEPAMQIRTDDSLGFEWLVDDDSDNGVIVFARHTESGHASMICLCNFQACVHYRYRFGVTGVGRWREIFNSDSVFYGGSNVGNGHGATTEAIPSHGHAQSLAVTVPPMAALYLRHETWFEEMP
ncbi:MAG: alpha amylase C-terminal domain-containing protein [Salinicola sp.]|uniref:alpha amylase C-terminal domain-containing protein n=1 Tax=Salinicola sp. TaxID=1978524 RepID=UPI001DE4E029|nr:alpha amylase C-terminal domain-containing protein [Salinicola sp.]NRB55906.1 alpha amylase C-terminal domain-containing protein [Salinicola sp.]